MAAWSSFLFATASPMQIYRATKIPLPTVKMFMSGVATPGKSSYNKMWNFYRRIQYNQLRVMGATTTEAKKYQSRAPAFIDKMSERYSKLIGNMSDLTGVDPDIIALNIGKSAKELDDLERSPKVIGAKMGFV